MSAAERGPVEQESTGQLIGRATDDIGTLIRTEIALAKDDLSRTGRQAATGAGLFGAAGILALGGFGALVAAAVLGVAEALDPWLSALVVAAGLFVIAGVAALVGKAGVTHLDRAPKERAESLRRDAQAVKNPNGGAS